MRNRCRIIFLILLVIGLEGNVNAKIINNPGIDRRMTEIRISLTASGAKNDTNTKARRLFGNEGASAQGGYYYLDSENHFCLSRYVGKHSLIERISYDKYYVARYVID